MYILELENVSKRFGDYQALQSMNLGIPPGVIFALLGPNGAGKTTLLRIITHIIAADSGRVLFEGKENVENRIRKIGYMPEERGLYKKMKVGEQLRYLTALKLGNAAEAKKKVIGWLKRLNIEDWYNKPVSELSKGMSQKVQFIATVAHDPQLIILDEPFSGLDPINSQLIEDEIIALRDGGASILFSTHRMEQVEGLCEEIALVNKGRLILNGRTKEIKNRYKKNYFRIGIEGALPVIEETPFLHLEKQSGNELLYRLYGDHTPNELLRHLLDKGVELHSFNEVLPTINEIFIEQVSTRNDE